jgi:hypothetical protein
MGFARTYSAETFAPLKQETKRKEKVKNIGREKKQEKKSKSRLEETFGENAKPQDIVLNMIHSHTSTHAHTHKQPFHKQDFLL